MKEILTKIEFNYDNLEVLEIIKYLVGVVINDIDFMNNLEYEKEEYNLGNNYIIKNEDLESLVSIQDTIQNVLDYNGGRKI